jgi:hypothetical protein
MVVGLLAACASSILDGEHARTGAVLTALPDTATVELFFEGKTQPASYSDVGQVTSRAFVLEKALEELKRQARALGASGVIGVTYERKFSVDYLQDLYFAKGTAVVIK